MYDTAVYIGRFQPFHNGHLKVVQEAQKIAKRVLILVGSANSSPSIKNPFTFDERSRMIEDVIDSNVTIGYLDDYTYEENQWLADVQVAVGTEESNVCIIGHSKDESSYYLKNFPQWNFIDVEYHDVIDATHIRELMFTNKLRFIEGAVPTSVMAEISRFTSTDKYLALRDEWNYVSDYKKDWAGSPYQPTFNTVDAVVVQSGHILLVQRKDPPGVGQWALPGGFLDPTETQIVGMMRELREETKLKVPEPVLRGSVRKEMTFAAVGRSTRGRTITQAYLIQLDDSQELPKIKAASDAKKAKWIPLAKFYEMPELMFEDHYHIVRKLLDNM